MRTLGRLREHPAGRPPTRRRRDAARAPAPAVARPAPAALDGRAAQRVLRRLGLIGLADLTLLIVLLLAAAGGRDLVSTLGPLHGAGLAAEVLLARRGAKQGWWGWWYVAAIVLTAGPLGLAFGLPRARRQLHERSSGPGPDGRPPAARGQV